MLGISTGAVRNRLSRGTLASAKEKGVVYVLLPVDMSRDAGRDTDDMSAEMSQPDSGALISEMHDRLRYVEGHLEAPGARRSKKVAHGCTGTHPAATGSALRDARILCAGLGGYG